MTSPSAIDPRDSFAPASVEADISRELTQVGLSNRAAWISSGVMFASGGTFITSVHLTDPHLFPPGVVGLSLFALFVSGLCFAGARYVTDAPWAVHLRLVLGLAIYAAGVILMDDERIGFQMFPLITLVMPTYLFATRLAIPYVAYLSIFVLAVAVGTHGPAPLGQGLVAMTVFWMLATAFMISRKRTREIALKNRELATTDPLTGLTNTRDLRERLEGALAESTATGRPIFLFALDLDNFKQVNDSFDHATGDRVLKGVADAIRSCVSGGDVAARRGGDEFSILMTAGDELAADSLKDRVANAIVESRQAICPEITPSGSIAWVTSEPDDTVARILQRADDELHDAKHRFHAGDEPGRRERRRTDFDSTQCVGQARAPAARDFVRQAGTVARWRAVFAGAHPIWMLASMVFIPIGLLVAVLASAGLFRPMSPAAGAGVGLALIAVGGACVAAAVARLSMVFLHVVFATGAAIVAAGALLAGESGAAIVDLLVAITVNAFFYFRTRLAFVHFFVYMGTYCALMIGSGYPSAVLRAVITTGATLMVTGIVSKLRAVTISFSDINRQLSEIDALTGVANMRAFGSRLRQLSRDGEKSRFSLIALDLDRFKDVNDSYNHTTGDKVLESVARAVVDTVSENDLVARRGGDEFFVLCDSDDPDRPAEMAARLGLAIEHVRGRICPNITPSASIGFTHWKRDESPEDFMRSADLALHEEKLLTRSAGYDRATA